MLPTFIQKFQAHPKVFLAAENDQEIRQIVSAHTGLRLDGSWTKLGSGTIGMYVEDVLSLVSNDSSLWRESAKLGDDCVWLIVSGSLCQDLTRAGPFHGFFGITGKRSVYFLVTQHVIWWFVVRFGRCKVIYIFF